jgi:hypothetical protein
VKVLTPYMFLDVSHIEQFVVLTLTGPNASRAGVHTSHFGVQMKAGARGRYTS